MSTPEQSQTENSTTKDQGNVSSDEGTNQSQQSTGSEEVVSKEEYKRLQAEYTKSRQELSEYKKKSDVSEEDQKAIDFLKENEFLTKGDLESAIKKQTQENQLDTIIANNRDLSGHTLAIKELVKSTGLAPEDVIEKYGFKSKDKLAKAKGQGDVKGMPGDNTAKSIMDMSEEEYTKWKQEKGIGNKGTFG